MSERDFWLLLRDAANSLDNFNLNKINCDSFCNETRFHLSLTRSLQIPFIFQIVNINLFLRSLSASVAAAAAANRHDICVIMHNELNRDIGVNFLVVEAREWHSPTTCDYAAHLSLSSPLAPRSVNFIDSTISLSLAHV